MKKFFQRSKLMGCLFESESHRWNSSIFFFEIANYILRMQNLAVFFVRINWKRTTICAKGLFLRTVGTFQNGKKF
uniref:Uncharacterized protein n=1 Tax=Anguilla anguilla TaxID=7936 RepID=A0A0E9TZT1_ANGAN